MVFGKVHSWIFFKGDLQLVESVGAKSGENGPEPLLQIVTRVQAHLASENYGVCCRHPNLAGVFEQVAKTSF